MVMVRCENCGAPKGITHKYVASVKPVGYPNRAVLCCLRDCNRGLV